VYRKDSESTGGGGRNRSPQARFRGQKCPFFRLSQAQHHHYPPQHQPNTFADVFADGVESGKAVPTWPSSSPRAITAAGDQWKSEVITDGIFRTDFSIEQGHELPDDITRKDGQPMTIPTIRAGVRSRAQTRNTNAFRVGLALNQHTAMTNTRGPSAAKLHRGMRYLPAICQEEGNRHGDALKP
jgi:hypothetical protein